MWHTLIGLVFPLWLDTFAISAALGMSGLTRRDRLRVTALFTGFEMGMPIVGIVLGAFAGNVAGNAADYVAIAILIGLGVFLLWPRREGLPPSGLASASAWTSSRLVSRWACFDFLSRW